jgi:hypothetical protein
MQLVAALVDHGCWGEGKGKRTHACHAPPHTFAQSQEPTTINLLPTISIIHFPFIAASRPQ